MPPDVPTTTTTTPTILTTLRTLPLIRLAALYIFVACSPLVDSFAVLPIFVFEKKILSHHEPRRHLRCSRQYRRNQILWVCSGVDRVLGFYFVVTERIFRCFSGGKRDEHLILPLNDSVSLTLDCDQVRLRFINRTSSGFFFYNLNYCYFFLQMHSQTSVIAGPCIEEDSVWLNGRYVILFLQITDWELFMNVANDFIRKCAGFIFVLQTHFKVL